MQVLDFPLSSKPEDVVCKAVLIHTKRYKIHGYTVVYFSTGCLGHDVAYHFHCFVVHNIATLNVGQPHCLKVHHPWALFSRSRLWLVWPARLALPLLFTMLRFMVKWEGSSNSC